MGMSAGSPSKSKTNNQDCQTNAHCLTHHDHLWGQLPDEKEANSQSKVLALWPNEPLN